MRARWARSERPQGARGFRAAAEATLNEGVSDAALDGMTVVGTSVGKRDGTTDGATVGVADGRSDGANVGTAIRD